MFNTVHQELDVLSCRIKNISHANDIDIVIYLRYIMDIWVLCYFLYHDRRDTVVLSRGGGGGGGVGRVVVVHAVKNQ